MVQPMYIASGQDEDDLFADDDDDFNFGWQNDTEDIDEILEDLEDLDDFYSSNNNNNNNNNNSEDSRSGYDLDPHRVANIRTKGNRIYFYEEPHVKRKKNILRAIALVLVLFAILYPVTKQNESSQSSELAGGDDLFDGDNTSNSSDSKKSNASNMGNETIVTSALPTKSPIQKSDNDITGKPTPSIEGSTSSENTNPPTSEGNATNSIDTNGKKHSKQKHHPGKKPSSLPPPTESPIKKQVLSDDTKDNSAIVSAESPTNSPSFFS